MTEYQSRLGQFSPYGISPYPYGGGYPDYGAKPNWWEGLGEKGQGQFSGNLSDLIFGIGGLMSSYGTKPPKQTGWETLFPQDSSGRNIYNLNQFTNDQNFWKSLGFDSGAYNPSEGLSDFFQQNGVAGDIAGFISNEAKGYDQLLMEQARGMVGPTMENIASQLSASGNLYSGAFGSQASKALGDISLQSGLASQQNKFAMLAQLLPQLAGQQMNQYQQMWMPEWAQPTIAPKYDQGQEPSDLQSLLGGGLQVASLLAKFLPLLI